MTRELTKIKQLFESALAQALDLEMLQQVRVTFLGKKGSLTTLLHSLKDLSASERPAAGQKVNDLRAQLEAALNEKQNRLEGEAESRATSTESIDIGLPGRRRELGTLHPLTIVQRKIVSFFQTIGFGVEEGPEIETDYYNFEALNFPADHPARDMQDTFFLEDGLLLRTHTSPVQIRVMENNPPPIRMVNPGRVYRYDSDVTHSPVFHQVEGLCVGPDITFAHLKGTIEAFVRHIFGPDVPTRFRPSFFPFTEPSADVYAKGPNGWMEILGCGMVDPNVFENVGKKWTAQGKENPYDPAKVSGFAFGLGVERIAMIRYGITDIRLFYENDVRFLEQFRE